MPRSEALKRAQERYISKKWDMLGVRVPKEEGAKIRAFSSELGLSVSALVLASIREYMENHPLKPEKIPHEGSSTLPD